MQNHSQDGIDISTNIKESLLTSDERAEYNRVNAISGGGGIAAAGIGLLTLTAVLGGGVFLLAESTHAEWPVFTGNIVTPIGVIVTALGVIATFFTTSRLITQKREQRDKKVRIFALRINYDSRVRQKESALKNDRDAGSLRSQQRAWYGDHQDLDWHDRTAAKSYGMSADEYINNVKENDRD
ncbi:hypothetical protein [Agreia sp. Leaf283]|uniref:hypothetical protein n=1 Tax=Agreia sp. Leaf283 TaxID=1736321 RepID=UPI0012F9C8F8|nr:hypothetical protein [Agreia sp. Leaf283]